MNTTKRLRELARGRILGPGEFLGLMLAGTIFGMLCIMGLVMGLMPTSSTNPLESQQFYLVMGVGLLPVVAFIMFVMRRHDKLLAQQQKGEAATLSQSDAD